MSRLDRITLLFIVLALVLSSGCAGGKATPQSGDGAAPVDRSVSFTDFSRSDHAVGADGPWTPSDTSTPVDYLAPDTLSPDTQAQPTGTITVTAPTSGQKWQAGSQQKVTWTSTGSISTVKIELWRGTTRARTIATSQPNNGSFTWSILGSESPATNYTIRVIDAQSATTRGESSAFSIVNWQYRRIVTIDGTRSTTTLKAYAVAIDLPSNFNYSHAASGGADLRFSLAKDLSSPADLSYWIERWNQSGSRIWINVPTLTAKQSTTIYLYYGNSAATSQSSISKTFPSRMISTGNLTLSGAQSYDWFELKSGHTLTVSGRQPLKLSARRMLVAGKVVGNSGGYLGGTGVAKGSGPGGGGTSSNGGAGGGGHGGAGGLGGRDSADTPGAGGVVNGSTTSTSIDMGSGGGGAGTPKGGHGGGAVQLTAHAAIVSGRIEVNGAGGGGGSRSAGGGAGGGVLILAPEVIFSGALTANGGIGGSGSSSANDGGGGGGGGRVKVIYQKSYKNTGTITVTGGAGGRYGTTAHGQPGIKGTTYTAKRTNLDLTPASVGAEASF